MKSRLFRSVFRVGWPRTRQARLQAMLSSLVLHVHPTRVRVHVLRPSYTLGLGLVSFYLLAILTVTGLALMLYYVPHPDAAYRSMKDIEYAVTFSMFLRNAHRWAAHGMVALCYPGIGTLISNPCSHYFFLHLCFCYRLESWSIDKVFHRETDVVKPVVDWFSDDTHSYVSFCYHPS